MASGPVLLVVVDPFLSVCFAVPLVVVLVVVVDPFLSVCFVVVLVVVVVLDPFLSVCFQVLDPLLSVSGYVAATERLPVSATGCR